VPNRGIPMNKTVLGIAIIVVCSLTTGWIWLGKSERVDIPANMMMTAEELRATPDFALIHMTFSELRLKALAHPDGAARWRALPEEVRRILVLSWVEESFPGFSGFLLRQQSWPFHFQADDLIDAYTALGAVDVAAAVEDAVRQARDGTASEQNASFATVDARFRELRSRADVARRIRAAIRLHAEEIVVARW